MNLSFTPILVATNPPAGASLSPTARGSASRTGQLPAADLPAFTLQEAAFARPARVAVPCTPLHSQGSSSVAAKGECAVGAKSCNSEKPLKWLLALACICKTRFVLDVGTTCSHLLELLLLRAVDVPVAVTWLQLCSTKLLGESFFKALRFGREGLRASS